jgi:hypothetical protein
MCPHGHESLAKAGGPWIRIKKPSVATAEQLKFDPVCRDQRSSPEAPRLSIGLIAFDREREPR